MQYQVQVWAPNPTGDYLYFGPFPTPETAQQYADSNQGVVLALYAPGSQP